MRKLNYRLASKQTLCTDASHDQQTHAVYKRLIDGAKILVSDIFSPVGRKHNRSTTPAPVAKITRSVPANRKVKSTRPSCNLDLTIEQEGVEVASGKCG
ncbi:unnamed protein product [Dibothriocephalus latus]|uniref:Uncharacterized protein n=1 Tax=Dibothriocephalus latus TaxID=60516 RepID=A0A3P7LUB9_DIBLA|nr:unnamed protein product [Dibothriocephalus latus]